MKKYTIILTVVLLCALLTGCCLSHEWQEATCEAPKTCAKCGETEGAALEHTWEIATCEMPKTCAKCGTTEGDALGHKWEEATWTKPEKCVSCDVTQGTAKNYFAVNDLEVKELPKSIIAKGIRYNPQNWKDQEQMDVEIIPVSCDIVLNGDFKEITFEYKTIMNARHNNRVNYLTTGFESNLYDLYTGCLFSGKELKDNSSYDTVFTVTIDGTDYDIIYKTDVEWRHGSWETATNGDEFAESQCHIIQKFKVPHNYEGLVLSVSSVNTFERVEKNHQKYDEEMKYALDELENKNVDSVQYFHIRDF